MAESPLILILYLKIQGPLYVPFVIGLGALVAVVIGYWFTRSISIFSDSIAEMSPGSYFKCLGQCLLDIGATLSLLVSIATVIRIPFLLMGLFSGSSKKKPFRTQFYLNFLMIFVDLLSLPFFLFLFFTIIRAPSLFRKIKKKSLDNSWDIAFSIKLRAIIFKLFFRFIFEIMVMIFSVILLLVPYRIPIAARKIKESTSFGKSMTSLFKQEWNAIVDLIVILISSIILITVIRLYPAIRNIKDGGGAGERRLRALWQTCLVFRDLFSILCMVFLFITVYRFPRLVRKVRNDGWRHFYNYAIEQFGKFLRDIPFFFMGIIVTVLVWRFFFMMRDIILDHRWRNKRKSVIHHFKMLFIDILDTPFVLASLLILVTIWRAYYFIKNFPREENTKRADVRRYIFSQFIALLLDVPTAMALLILAVTVYRFPGTVRQLKEYFKLKSELKSGAVNNVAPSPPPASPEDEDSPAPSKPVIASSWRWIVGKEFILLIIDTPFPILLLLTLWRLPILIGRLREITDASRQYTQRRLLILRYLLFVLLDILCIIPVLMIIVTVWRVPSFIKLIREYKRGDNEHRMVGILFSKMLVDIPFVILGVCCFIFPWRGIGLVFAVYKESKSDNKARYFAACYFGLLFVDILNFISMLIIGGTMWRVLTFIFIIKYKFGKIDPKVNRWNHTSALSFATTRTLLLIMMDILTFFQTIVILLFVSQVGHTIKEIRKLNEGSNTFEEKRKIINYSFIETLRDIPHIPNIPLKLAGFVFVPIHLYLDKRTKKTTEIQSFLNLILIWLHDISKQCLNYYKMDKFFIINLLGSIVIVPNELGLCLVLINCIYLFVVTLGCPLWKSTREKFGWDKLGNAQGPMVFLEYITVVLQTILFPVFLFAQLIILMLPILVSLSQYNSVKPLSFTEFWTLIFESSTFWKNSHRFSAGIWVLQAFWVLVCVVSWQMTFKVSKKYFPIVSPVKAYYWLIKKVFVKRFWGLYKMILATGTKVCYRLRRACFLGEILMFPLFIVWTCWPIIIPIATKIYYIFIGAVPLALLLMFFAYKVIRLNWGDTSKEATQQEPVIRLSGVFVNLPESGGIIFTFVGQKPSSDFKIRDARLSLDSDALWKAIEKALGKAKIRTGLMLIGYPISLYPMFFDINQINVEQHNISFTVSFGAEGSKFLLKKKVLLKTLNAIIQVDDAPFDFVIEYGKKDFGWQKQGVLCKFNTKPSIIIELGSEGGDTNEQVKAILNGQQDLESMAYTGSMVSPPTIDPSIPKPPPPPPTKYIKPPPLIVPTQNNNPIPNNSYNNSNHQNNSYNGDFTEDEALRAAIELSKQDYQNIQQPNIEEEKINTQQQQQEPESSPTTNNNNNNENEKENQDSEDLEIIKNNIKNSIDMNHPGVNRLDKDDLESSSSSATTGSNENPYLNYEGDDQYFGTKSNNLDEDY
eukprot:gene11100-13580_t